MDGEFIISKVVTPFGTVLGIIKFIALLFGALPCLKKVSVDGSYRGKLCPGYVYPN